MPFVRISLRKGKSQEYLAALADNVQRALVETFDVPENDRFQAIHQHDENELIFDRSYLAGPRSDDFVYISITIGRPRTAEMKAALYRRLAELLAQSPGLRSEDVMVVVSTSASEDWSFGAGIAQMTDPDWRLRAVEKRS
ncbi:MULTISPECIES: tautomerase family protein [Rhizobium]|uniref:tautomerase family protein n=1 Tax=Rhizobium TaxID=379 RepID=UPI0007E93EF7|nr:MULTISPECIES: tautomerase family protein [Rhizobium]ANK93140.1 4-oxalocrotonate tautomerase protein [Rhizobium sp. N6212]ANK99186.1 4-oxalocrotonate tautomerase protein [Rhizobium sp. N621]ANL05317.1 4-oxalocrotonate tautomerase protein [Rhizobium esperanzae]ANL11370.1 4-oxalocrotonate tautomerase protein [Rhizobium sp. N1341]ANL23442.1 4-oxalocrotonate tautomerase protein [Rhizobium sp. N113]